MPKFSNLPTDDTVLSKDGYEFWFNKESDEGLYLYYVSGPGFDSTDDTIHVSAEPPGGGDEFTTFHITPERWDVGARHFYYNRGEPAGKDIKLPDYDRRQLEDWLKADDRLDSLKACAAAFWAAVVSAQSVAALQATLGAPEFVPAAATQGGMSANAPEFVPSGAFATAQVPHPGPYYTEHGLEYWLDESNQPYFIAADGNAYAGIPGYQ